MSKEEIESTSDLIVDSLGIPLTPYEYPEVKAGKVRVTLAGWKVDVDGRGYWTPQAEKINSNHLARARGQMWIPYPNFEEEENKKEACTDLKT